MALFLVARTFDVSQAPLPLKEPPRLLIEGAADVRFTATGHPGVFEAPLPEGTTRATVAIAEPGAWPIDQRLDITPGKPPTLAWGGGLQQLGSRNLEVFNRGSADFNLQVSYVVGDMRDGSDVVQASIDAEPDLMPMFPLAQPMRLFSDPLLVEGKGWDRLNFKLDSLSRPPRGQLFVAERPTAPRLVAAWVPEGTFAGDKRGPVAYHVYFSPGTSHFTSKYPSGREWPWLYSRYLFQDRARFGYAMVNQHDLAGKRPVIVFPVASPTVGHGGSTTQAGLLRLLQELSWFLQRRANPTVAFPQQTVGKVAVSAFSIGAVAIQTLMGSTLEVFEKDHLREVYGIDFHLDGGIGPFCDRLKRWLNGGADGRRVRIYTSKDGWGQAMKGVSGKPPIATGPGGSFVEDSEHATLLMASLGLWFQMAREGPKATDAFDAYPKDDDEVHHMIPQLYFQHAIRRSSFAG